MKPVKRAHAAAYDGLLSDVAHVIEAARHAAARSVNAVMTITYWLIGRRIINRSNKARRVPAMERSCSNAWPAIYPSVSVVASPNGILSKCGPSISAGQFRRQRLRN